MTRRLLLLAAALVVLANVLVLAGVARNRTGEPEATLVLTPRELKAPWRSDEQDSGVSLRLEINAPYRSRSSGPFRDKLRDVGLDPNAPQVLRRADDPNSSYVKSQSRRALAVLELDGEEWRRWLDGWEADPNHWIKDPNTLSRLFVVDVGLDAAALRTHYPDRRRYAIIPASVSMVSWWNDGLEGAHVVPLVTALHVPRQHSAGLGPPDAAQDARAFKATVSYGSRLEPWIERIEPGP